MPPRHFGLGFRSRVTLAPICFASCMCRVLPRMLDSSDLQGAHKAGFLPQLAPLLGAGSFDAGVRLRFAHFLGASSSLGNDFQTAWDDLRAQLPPDPEGLLALEAAAGGGADTDHLQRRLTSELERHWAQVLDVACRGLPAEDVRRSAWMNLDTFSTVWVSCWPHKDAYLSNEEFVEVATRYMGLPSPSCEISAGEPIGNTRSVLDRFGMRLSTATLPGDGLRVQHDSILWRLVEDCREMGVPVQPEVYGLFASCLPQPAAQQFRDLPVRQRQGLVPDLLCTLQWDGRGPARRLLFEVKTLHCGPSTYPSGPAARCSAVNRRAGQLPGEYAAKARRVDEQYAGAAAGSVGPVLQRLQGFSPVRGFVFGSFGEASADVSKLLDALAWAGARKHMGPMGAASLAVARSSLHWLLRRRWAMTACRENARLTLGRLEYVGRGAAAAAGRRRGHESGAAAARRASCWERRGPVLRPLAE
jgi:hypothetical protein